MKIMKLFPVCVITGAMFLCSCATSADPTWHNTRSARFATWGISGAGAGSLGYASAHERFEVGGEVWGIASLFAYVGAGPYVRLRPIPGESGRKYFLHTAGYGGFLMGPGGDDSQWSFIPNAFIGYEPARKSDDAPQRFYGIGAEGIFIFGQRF